LDISEQELDQVTPLLYGSGAAALGWWRVRQTDLRATSSAQLLREGYRLQSLQGAIHEENIKNVLQLLRESSIESILVKGWAAASLYPERALRPYGDIDLCVRASSYSAAAAVLAVTTNQLANAIRLVSVEKGHDPRDFALFAFGGAGPLHAVEIARELGIPTVLVPRFPGITSGLGCVLADVRHDFVQSVG